mgnify:CR=1 FL=1|tara:strand:- start:471746 stop:473029 length:1284 start_codon:yes stop_codon:yes gene_type:complete
MYPLYRIVTRLAAKPLLNSRLAKGKEDAKRINERMGQPKIKRPNGTLIWMHGASVGEVTSLLTLVHKLQAANKEITVLITSGTKTSAEIISKRGLKNVIHQYIPMDHPLWVKTFLDHWAPDAVIFAESEIWPNLLTEIGRRNIPSALINARLSDKSYKGWRRFRKSVTPLLRCFDVILTQSAEDKRRYIALGHTNVHECGNIKYSAEKLPAEHENLLSLQNRFKGRPTWVYASTHDGEELIACEIHNKIKKILPNLLTFIVPRHPERRNEIAKTCDNEQNEIIFRSAMQTPPADTEIYIIDTLGELGLFYRLSETAVIGRTLSNDGGGGHNPIEAAQLGCATLHGPLYQNQKDIFDDMHKHEATVLCRDKDALYDEVLKLFSEPDYMEHMQDKALAYTQSKTAILDSAYDEILKILPKTIFSVKATS